MYRLSSRSLLRCLRPPPCGTFHAAARDTVLVGSRLSHSRSTPSLPDASGTSLYLHVSPSGDIWTGAELFAAKHLQPDYVTSILIPEEHRQRLFRDPDCEEDQAVDGIWAEEEIRKMYDDGNFVVPKLIEN